MAKVQIMTTVLVECLTCEQTAKIHFNTQYLDDEKIGSAKEVFKRQGWREFINNWQCPKCIKDNQECYTSNTLDTADGAEKS